MDQMAVMGLNEIINPCKGLIWYLAESKNFIILVFPSDNIFLKFILREKDSTCAVGRGRERRRENPKHTLPCQHGALQGLDPTKCEIINLN